MRAAKLSSVCLIGATFNTNNMGVSALAEGAIRAVLAEYQDAKVILLDYGKTGSCTILKEGCRTIEIKLVNIRMSKRIYLSNHILMLLLMALLHRLAKAAGISIRRLEGNACLRTLVDADEIACLSGGDSFSETYGLGRFIYVALPQFLAIILGKAPLILPQTLGPFRSSIGVIMARYILRRAKVVYSRDYRNLETGNMLLGARAKEGNVKFSYDLGFLVEAVEPLTNEWTSRTWQGTHGTDLVGVNVSGLLMMGGYSRKNMFGLKDNYREIVSSVLEKLLEISQLRIILIPHVFGGYEHAESDVTACLYFYEKYKGRYENRICVVQERYTQGEIKWIIGSCKYFVGSRMHACVAALSQGIPTVPIVYSEKFIGVIESLGIEPLVADARILGREEIAKMVETGYLRQEEYRKALGERLPSVLKSARSVFRDLREEMECHPMAPSDQP